jgi:hypothetical protein
VYLALLQIALLAKMAILTSVTNVTETFTLIMENVTKHVLLQLLL